MIEMGKSMSRNLTPFWRKNRFSKAQGLWYNSRVGMAAQDSLCATKRPNSDPHVPLGTLKIEPALSFDSLRVLKHKTKAFTWVKLTPALSFDSLRVLKHSKD